MNFFKWLFKGRSIRVTLPWPGEQGLGEPKEPENQTQHEFNVEFMKEQDRKKREGR